MKPEYRKYNVKSSRVSTEKLGNIEIPFDRAAVQQILGEELHNFAVEMGRIAVIGLLEDEVRRICGEWHVPNDRRTLRRHGAQRGWVTVGGQKVSVLRPRVRSADGRVEARLPLYERMQDRRLMTEAVLRRMLRGASCRDYRAVVDCARESFGVKRSSVSKAFQEGMAERIKRLSERRWDGVRFVAIFIDGKVYDGEMMIAVVGVKADGAKCILGLRQGATENTEVTKDLLEDLVSRGVVTEEMTLFILDGGKALRAAVKRVWGRYAVIQRCQEHKRRNLEGYLGEGYWPELGRRLAEAFKGNDYRQSLKVLENTVIWLKGINPDAARSLQEGMEETITVVRLGIPALLRRSLSTTNVIESGFSVADVVSGRVKRWLNGEMRWRWCAAGLMCAEERFHRVQGYEQIPLLITALDELAKTEGLDSVVQVA
jgi:putative transposase